MRALAALRAAVIMLPAGFPLGALCSTRGSILGLFRIDLIPQAIRPQRGDVWSLALRALGERYRAEARVVLVRRRSVYVRFTQAPRLLDDDGQDNVPLGEARVSCRLFRAPGEPASLFALRVDHGMPVAALRVSGIDLELGDVQLAEAEVLDGLPFQVELRLEHASGATAEAHARMSLESYRIEEATAEFGQMRRYRAHVKLTRLADAAATDHAWEEFLAAARRGGPTPKAQAPSMQTATLASL